MRAAFGANPARPGTVNYIEGEATLDGNQLNEQNVGSADLNAGDVLETGAGKVEVLLTPGIFLRIGDHSAVKMISPDLTLTQVELERGRAGVEVDEIYPQNDIQVLDGGVATQLLKTGYYEFDANHPTLLVFKGKAAVALGDKRYEVVKGGREMVLAPGAWANRVKFNTNDAEDDLYNWSSLRSEYLAEANNQIAGEYAGVDGFYPGWYWDPYMWDYTFIGGGPFWSPFGFGFYPPWGWYGGYWGGGFYGRGFGGRGFGGHGGFGHGGFGHGGFGHGGFGHGGFGGGGFHGGGRR